MESEVGKLKEKIDMLEAKIEEQDNLLKDCSSTCSRKARETKEDVSVHKTEDIQVNIRMKGILSDPKTCLEARTADPTLDSGMFWIDPDGQGRGDDPIYVYCNMTTGRGFEEKYCKEIIFHIA